MDVKIEAQIRYRSCSLCMGGGGNYVTLPWGNPHWVPCQRSGCRSRLAELATRVEQTSMKGIAIRSWGDAKQMEFCCPQCEGVGVVPNDDDETSICMHCGGTGEATDEEKRASREYQKQQAKVMTPDRIEAMADAICAAIGGKPLPEEFKYNDIP